MDRFYRGLELNVDAERPGSLNQQLDQEGIEPLERPDPSMKYGHARARPRGQVRELERNVPSAGKRDGARELFQIHELLTRRQHPVAGDFQRGRFCPGGHDHSARLEDRGFRDADRVPVLKPGLTVENGDAGFVERRLALPGHRVGKRSFKTND